MKRGIAAAVLALALAGPGAARQKTMDPALRHARAELRWSELSPVILERQVAIQLSDGQKVRGEVLAVRDEALVLDIRKTSDRKTWPKGQTAIPRGTFSELKVVRHSGPLRVICAVLGTVGGVALVSAVAVATDSVGVLWLNFLIPPLTGTAGYYGGKAGDTRTTTIRVVPDDGGGI